MNNKKIQQAPFIILIASVLFLPASPSLAKSEYMKDKHRLAIGVGAVFVNFDTNAKYTNKDSGRSIFVDLEGTLGLQQYQTEPLISYYQKWADAGGAGAPRYVKINGIGKVDEIRDAIYAGLDG